MLADLSQRLALQANTLTSDGGGGYTAAWQTFAQVWAKIMPLGAADAFGPDARESRARHRIVLRDRTDVFAGMRAVTGTRCFVVHGVLRNEPRLNLMTLLCEELP